MQFVDFKNTHAMLMATVDRYRDQPAYRWFTAPGQTESVTWGEFYNQVGQVAKSLMTLGVEPGDKVNIISYSCYRWVLTDMGIMSAGAATVGIYQSNLPKDCQYIIDHSDAVVVFAEDNQQMDKLFEIRAQIPDVRKVILFSGDAPDDDWVISYEDFLALGQDVSDKDFDQRAQAATPQDPAGIVYTSGTTGVPKGAVLTHDNITFTAQSVKGSTRIEEGDEVFLFLPLAHVFARTCVYATLLVGCPTTFTRSMETVVEDMQFTRPHWFASVPRIYEKVYSKVISGAEAKGGAALKIFKWACEVGGQVSDLKIAKKPIPVALGLKYALASKLVFSKIQAALGGRVRWCISGAAPLNQEIGRFFHAAGVLIVEGIGMTENTSFSNLNRYDNYRFGWVGQPGPGVEQKLGEDGEVMFRGRNVMKEYYKMPKETAATITEDGWLLSGDIGEIDDQNFLRITGRKKELIITAGGKNIAPAAIEGVIATSKYINQVFVIGDRRKFLSALVTLDEENVRAWADAEGISYSSTDDLMANEKVQTLIDAEVATKNAQFASFESIKKVTIVPEFTIANGLITPTLKVKKNVVAVHYEEAINQMYPVD
ncbi:MAG: long-chain fatty acid--CoA ligase [Desulfobacteraceae bacterium]|nr:long-chain fatty acid--CoA ligase [Desulfobacteraceae bacterium]MBC2750555.1 long-chain fatty acid--CoA ligase [Desulfobacteraceae bacterium]